MLLENQTIRAITAPNVLTRKQKPANGFVEVEAGSANKVEAATGNRNRFANLIQTIALGGPATAGTHLAALAVPGALAGLAATAGVGRGLNAMSWGMPGRYALAARDTPLATETAG